MDFLKYFITEPVFVIPEAQASHPEEHNPKKITAAEPVPEPAEKKTLEFKVKGTNRNKILIIVDQPGETFISKATEDFLSKVLGAVQLKTDDVAIINLQENPDITEDMVMAFDAEKHLVFGVSSGKLYKNAFTPYELTQIENKHILNCSSLETIAGNTSEKKLLWTALQKMFL